MDRQQQQQNMATNPSTSAQFQMMAAAQQQQQQQLSHNMQMQRLQHLRNAQQHQSQAVQQMHMQHQHQHQHQQQQQQQQMPSQMYRQQQPQNQQNDVNIPRAQSFPSLVAVGSEYVPLSAQSNQASASNQPKPQSTTNSSAGAGSTAPSYRTVLNPGAQVFFGGQRLTTGNNTLTMPRFGQQQTAPARVAFSPGLSALPHVAQADNILQNFFVSDTLRSDLLSRVNAIYATANPSDPRAASLPSSVRTYHTFVPLDVLPGTESSPSNVFGFPTHVYKCLNTTTGKAYVLRRIEGFRLQSGNALNPVEIWKHVRHPNIASLHDVFVSKDFDNTNSLCFVYDYHPNAVTLAQRYLPSANSTATIQSLTESQLWTIVVQLTSALHTIHSAGLACRSLHVSKIILTCANRVRLGSCSAITDVIQHDDKTSISQLQKDDLVALGNVILTLSCRNINAPQSPDSIEKLAATHGMGLKSLVLFLISPRQQGPSIDDVIGLLPRHLLREVDRARGALDQLEASLALELDNGRLFRLLAKLGFVNERPEFGGDRRWSETGDRYLLKLFRDYVFHQVYQDGRAAIDYGHVIESLNKLDAGIDEKIVLMSRDEQSMLVVSYKDLKRCLTEAYNELLKPSVITSSQRK